MIIGNNFNSNGNMFKTFSSLNKKHQNKNINFLKNIKEQHHTNPANNDEMIDKTLSMLNERLNNNEISIEEFNRQCTKLGKLKK